MDFERTDEVHALIERAVSGDEKAASTLVRAIAPTIQISVARALSKRRSQANGRDVRQELEDLMQETFAALFARRASALRSWDPARGRSFLSFVAFLSEREVAQHMRSMKSNPWTEDPTDDVDAETHLESALESRDLLRRVLEQIRDRASPLGLMYFDLLFLQARPIASVMKETGATRAALYAWRSRLGRLAVQIEAELA